MFKEIQNLQYKDKPQTKLNYICKSTVDGERIGNLYDILILFKN